MFGSIEKDFASRVSTAHSITLYCHSVKEEQHLLLELAAYLSGTLVIDEVPQQNNHLTYMEKLVYALMLEGFSTKESSEKLFIDIETVRSHKSHIYTKLNVHTKSAFLKKFLPRGYDDYVIY